MEHLFHKISDKRIRGDLVVLFFLITSFIFCYPLLQKLYLSCRGDWDYYFSLQEVSSISLFEYGQFPLWNPYCGGGMPFMGNPQTAFPSLIFLCTSFFGVFAGLKIAVWLHTFLGMWGMWLLSGYMGVKGPSRLVTSVIFMFNGAWVLHLTEGHINWLSSALLPFLFMAYLKGCENKWWLIAAAFVESLMFYEGGAYVFAFCLLFVCIYGILRAIEIKAWKPVTTLISMNIIAALLSAPKILPVLDLLINNPRIKSAENGLSWDDCLSLFICPEKTLNSFAVWEYGSYLGITVIIFYLASLTLFKKYQSLVLASIFIFLIAIGNFSEYSPWNVLHQLPLWCYFQAPTRALIVFNFTVSLLIGLYLGNPLKKFDIRMEILILIIVVYIAVDLFNTNSQVFAEAPKPVNVTVFRNTGVASVASNLYYIDPIATTAFWRSVPSVHKPFSQIRIPDLKRFAHGAWSDQYLPLLQNIGVVDAYETIPFARYARAFNDKDYRGEFYFVGKGVATQLKWSPNRLKYHVKLEQPDRLVINQNYWPGWRVTRGVVTRHNGLLAVDLPAGEYDLRIKYQPITFTAGLSLFFATLFSIAMILFMELYAKLYQSQEALQHLELPV
jgi:hypothetical protein